MNAKQMKNAITQELNTKKYNKSKWDRAVNEYAMELLDNIQEACGDWMPLSRTARVIEMLNGAESFQGYSWGGCSLIYNGDIAERVCTPSQLKRCKGGEWMPSRYEHWLDVQARALFQASNRLNRVINAVTGK